VVGNTTARSRRRSAWVAVGVAAVAVAASILIVASSPGGNGPTGSCGRVWQASPPTATPIKHLFVVVKENHAFENYFGDLPGVVGYPPNGSFPVSFNGSATVSPFPLAGTSTPDLPHDGGSEIVDYDHGRNDLFVAEAAANGASDPEDAVGYYTSAQIPDYYSYARNYTLGDEFFTGVLGPTFPNRAFDLSSYVGTWNADTVPPANVTNHSTILGQLTAVNIPWEYDYDGLPLFLAPIWYPALTGDPCSAARISSDSDLASQLRSSDPPAVVFLDPSNSGVYSEHPPQNVTAGEDWTVAVVNDIFSSPVANSSAVLIFFDEAGGFWDPVPPPNTSTGLDGFRIPFLVVSPWTPEGKVCSTVADPASVLHFIDENWEQPYLTERVATASNLSCYFEFSHAPRPPLILPTSVALGSAAPHGTARVLAFPPETGSAGAPTAARWVEPGAARAGEAYGHLRSTGVRQEVEGS
jgi:phospholipase C